MLQSEEIPAAAYHVIWMEECDKKSHNELLVISYPIHLG